jgi:hypothetical protein
MVKICCIDVGSGNCAVINIETGERVVDLKEKIKEKWPTKISYAASLLRVYLAKKSDGKWLTSADDDFKAVKQREAVPVGIMNLMRTN